MLATGIKTPVGIKFMGPDLHVLSDLASRASSIALTVPGTTSAYPERTFGGYYLDININRGEAARYGLTTGDVQDVISTALGGMTTATVVEGLERYPLNIRYARDFRDNPSAIKQVLVPTATGAQIPLGQLADIQINPGPPMVKSENSRRTAWVFVDVSGRDLGSYIADAQQAMSQQRQRLANCLLYRDFTGPDPLLSRFGSARCRRIESFHPRTLGGAPESHVNSLPIWCI